MVAEIIVIAVSILLIVLPIVITVLVVNKHEEKLSEYIKNGTDIPIEHYNSVQDRKRLFGLGYKIIEIDDKEVKYYVIGKKKITYNDQIKQKPSFLFSAEFIEKQSPDYILLISEKGGSDAVIEYMTTKDFYNKTLVGDEITLVHKKQVWHKESK